MHKTIKKYQKPIMTLFAVGLMITFVASIGNTPGGSGQRDFVVGTIYGDKKVHAQELNNARRAWDRIKRTALVNMMGDQAVPAYYRLSPLSVYRHQGLSIPMAGIDKDPDVFFALLQEDEALGLTASEDDVQELIRNVDPRMAPKSQEEIEELRYAFSCLLKVEAAYQRGSSILKVSAPQREVDAAQLGQELKVNFVAFHATEFTPAVAAPTPEQLLKQFNTYANFAPDQAVDETNTFGFGYRYGNRVKVEFITVLYNNLKDAVRKTKDDATWEIAARKEYLRNKVLYPATKPSEDTTETSSTTKPTTAPTTRPLVFEDYKKRILDDLIDEEAAKLGESVRKRITSTMDQDYNAYRLAAGNAATQPTSRPVGPSTALGVPYTSDQYLATLAQQIQKEFGVLPVTMTVNKDWQTQKNLAELPGIGQAELRGRNPYQPGVSFADIAINYPEAFGHVPSGRDPAPTLSILQPSPPLSDRDYNMHIFRLTGAEAAHAATELAPFAEQVEKDYRTAEAMKLARAEADKLLAPAKKDGLDAAAKTVGRRIASSGAINAGGIAPTDDLKLKMDSQRTLFKAAFELLQDPDAIKAGRTAAVVELPRDGKVLVITLADLKSTQPGRPLYQAESSFSRRMMMDIEDRFLIDWFNAENIAKRTKFSLDSKKQKPDQG